MELLTEKLTNDEIETIKGKYGNYVKVTVDVKNGWMVVGPELHADAVPMLEEKGSMEKNIWGGWIGFDEKAIDTMAVWNLRSEPNNPSMDILDKEIRESFVRVIKNIFECLWI